MFYSEFKNFNKYFKIYLLFILFFCCMQLFWKHEGGTDSTISEWLINYQGGFVRRGFLGVSLEPDPNGNAAVVASVVSGSAADEAGFLANDKIVKVGKKLVYSVNQARVAISQTLPGAQIQIEVLRNGEPETLYVTLGSMSEGIAPIPGLDLTVLTLQNREEFDIPDLVRGVLVSRSSA